jgi:hypothetical protein
VFLAGKAKAIAAFIRPYTGGRIHLRMTKRTAVPDWKCLTKRVETDLHEMSTTHACSIVGTLSRADAIRDTPARRQQEVGTCNDSLAEELAHDTPA